MVRDDLKDGASVADSESEDRAVLYLRKTPAVIVKDILKLIGIAFVCFLVICAVMLVTQRFILKKPVPSLFGYSALNVLTGSMSGTIEQGDVVIVKDTGDYRIGDIVTFVHDGESIPTTHRIVRFADGKYYTKGDANITEDRLSLSENKIEGKVVKTIPRIGLFFDWVKSGGGIFYIIGFVAMVIIGLCVLRQKSDDEGDGETGREEIESENQENPNEMSEKTTIEKSEETIKEESEDTEQM